MEHDSEKARNIKLILSTFEQLSGLKINFHKSELFCFGKVQDDANLHAELFGCRPGSFPINYLGIRFTIEDSCLLKGKLPRIDCRNDLVVGKENYYLWLEG
jgi:hypothetical protein